MWNVYIVYACGDSMHTTVFQFLSSFVFWDGLNGLTVGICLLTPAQLWCCRHTWLHSGSRDPTHDLMFATLNNIYNPLSNSWHNLKNNGFVWKYTFPLNSASVERVYWGTINSLKFNTDPLRTRMQFECDSTCL